MRFLMMIFLFAQVLLSQMVCAAAEQPATQPDSALAALEKVVLLSPLNLHTRGMSPKDALAAISKQTGMAIYPVAHRMTPPGYFTPASPAFDYWNSKTFAPLNFDIENSGFWEAVQKIAAFSEMGIDRGGRDVLIDTAMDDRSLGAPGMVLARPASLIHLLRGGMKLDAGHGYAWMNLYIDPRIRICSAAAIEILLASDELGGALTCQANLRATQSNNTWSMYVGVQFSSESTKSQRVSEFRGYIPVSVVTAFQTVEIPMQLGAAVEAGPWEVKLEDIGAGGHIVGAVDADRVFIGLERREGGDVHVPFPGTLYPLVRMLDEQGRALAETRRMAGGPVKATVSGGIRQWIQFERRLENGDPTTPAKLIVEVPLEIKRAMIPFEFSEKIAE